MADELNANPDSAAAAGRGWSHVWQMPALLLGIGLFMLGLYVSMPSREPDDFPAALEAVKLAVDAQQFDQAQQMLRTLDGHIERAPVDMKALYEQTWGDLVFHQQRVMGMDDPVNHQSIIGYYKQAATLGLKLSDERKQRLAESLLALGREDEALEVVSQMADAPAARRYAVIRRLIERQLETPTVKPHRVQTLVNRFLEEVAAEPARSTRRRQEIWGLAVKAQLLLDAGEADAAIAMVEPKLVSLMAQGADIEVAPLDILRAKAYQRKGLFGVARQGYEAARRKLDIADALNADVLVGLGQIELIAQDDAQAAWQHFRDAEQRYRPQKGDAAQAPYFDALVGRADCEARQGNHTDALMHIEEAVRLLTQSHHPLAERRERVVGVALSHHLAAGDLENYGTAKDYLDVLSPLHGQRPPAAWLSLYAATHERIASKMLRDAGLPAPQVAALGGGAVADPDEAARPPAVTRHAGEAMGLIRQDAAEHYERAGDYYDQHAREVLVADPESAGNSVWSAAEAYDRAFRWQRAIAMYNRFLGEHGDDPRRIEAEFRLGLAHLADGQYDAAIERLETLRNQHATHRVTAAALVPLARALDAVGRTDEAVNVLLGMVTDHPAITPDSREYNEALVALGRLYHRQGKYEEAIQRLETAVQRDGDSRQAMTVRFQLAEAYRQSVSAIDTSLQEPLPASKIAQYKAERQRRLERALVLHSQVVTRLGEFNEQDLSPIELLYLRNASFYRADCAFDLQRFEQSIELYDWAARRWKDHPASLVALVQMVNAYAELGQTQKARAVNLRAQDRLRRIKDSAFDDPSLPMKRKHWQDWLKWSNELRLFDAQASADTSDNADTSP